MDELTANIQKMGEEKALLSKKVVDFKAVVESLQMEIVQLSYLFHYDSLY